MRPSRLPPILTVCRWARPWVIPSRFSLRVSVQLSAWPMCLAAQTTRIASRSRPTLAPNPPPTSGATTRMAPGSSPSTPDRMNREICAFWVLTQAVSLPSSQVAAAARPSIGTGASRWFSMVCSTTTSQPSKALSSAGAPPLIATLVSAAGNSSVLPASAAS